MTWHTHLKITQPKKNYPNPNKKNPPKLKLTHSTQIKSNHSKQIRDFYQKNKISRLHNGGNPFKITVGYPFSISPDPLHMSLEPMTPNIV